MRYYSKLLCIPFFFVCLYAQESFSLERLKNTDIEAFMRIWEQADFLKENDPRLKEKLIQGVTSDNLNQRKYCALLYCQIFNHNLFNQKIFQILVKEVLSDKENRELRVYAISYLVFFKKEYSKIVSILIDIIKNEKGESVIEALTILGEISKNTESESSAKLILKNIISKSKNPLMVQSAIFSLGNLENNAKDLIPFLIKEFEKRNLQAKIDLSLKGDQRLAILLSLQKIGLENEKSYKSLLKYINDLQMCYDLRVCLVSILGTVKKPSVKLIKELEKVVNSRCKRIVLEALQGLGNFRSKSKEVLLILKMHTNHPDQEIRESVLKAVKRLSTK